MDKTILSCLIFFLISFKAVALAIIAAELGRQMSQTSAILATTVHVMHPLQTQVTIWLDLSVLLVHIVHVAQIDHSTAKLELTPMKPVQIVFILARNQLQVHWSILLPSSFSSYPLHTLFHSPFVLLHTAVCRGEAKENCWVGADPPICRQKTKIPLYTIEVWNSMSNR